MLTATLWNNKSKIVKSLHVGLLFSLSVVWAQQSPIAENATPTLYADGLQFTEGPLWTGDGLLVSDIYANAIYKVTEGNIEVWLEPSGHANGLVQNEEGDIIVAQHDRAVSQVDGKTLNVLANSYEGDKFNSPNDLALSRSGRVYFTDPTFGLLGPPLGLEGQEAELAFSGVYRLEEDGNVTLLADDLAAPNGLAFSPDASVLYVSDTATQALYVYDVAEDGTLSSGRLFYQFDTSLEGKRGRARGGRRRQPFCHRTRRLGRTLARGRGFGHRPAATGRHERRLWRAGWTDALHYSRHGGLYAAARALNLWHQPFQRTSPSIETTRPTTHGGGKQSFDLNLRTQQRKRRKV